MSRGEGAAPRVDGFQQRDSEARRNAFGMGVVRTQRHHDFDAGAVLGDVVAHGVAHFAQQRGVRCGVVVTPFDDYQTTIVGALVQDRGDVGHRIANVGVVGVEAQVAEVIVGDGQQAAGVEYQLVQLAFDIVEQGVELFREVDFRVDDAALEAEIIEFEAHLNDARIALAQEGIGAG